MPSMYAKLLTSLEYERDGYQGMLALCSNIQEAVLQNDIATLETLIVAQQELWVQIGEVDNQVAEQMRALGRLHSVPDEEIKLSVLIAKAEQELQEALWQVRSDLEALFEKQAWMNQTNQQLIAVQLAYTNHMLHELTVQDSLNNTYTQHGVETDDETRPIFQIKI